MAYVELMVGGMEARTCVTFIAKIKQRIHGDDKLHKLIKIVHICEGG